MELSEKIRLLTEPYEFYPLECDGLTRVLHTLLSQEGILTRIYSGKAIYLPTGEQTPPHLWLEVDTEEGRFRVDYRVRLWLQQGQDQQDIPYGVFHRRSFTQVLYEGEEMPLLPLDALHFRLLTHVGTLYPLGYRTKDADVYLQALMSDPRTLLVEARYTPFARNRPAWCRYGKQGLEQTWKERYHYYSNRTQGRGQENENWLGNKNYNTGGPIELVDCVEGLQHLLAPLMLGQNVIIVCGCPVSDYEGCHLSTIADGLRQVLPHLPVVLQQPAYVSVQDGVLQQPRLL